MRRRLCFRAKYLSYLLYIAIIYYTHTNWVKKNRIWNLEFFVTHLLSNRIVEISTKKKRERRKETIDSSRVDKRTCFDRNLNLGKQCVLSFYYKRFATFWLDTDHQKTFSKAVCMYLSTETDVYVCVVYV